MKPINEWTEADLQALVDGEEPESLTLEFKALKSLGSGNPERNELSKDVSAMANSDGGRIIYGIRETKKNGLPVGGSLDDDPDPPKITAESIEQRISGTIQPRPLGITIKAIPLQNGNTAFVLDIPQVGSNGPHQASDQKYYRRFNFQCVPMYDYEIRDIMRRGSAPDLEITLHTDGLFGEEPNRFRTYAAIGNRSNEPALYYTITMILDGRFSTGRIDEYMKGETRHIKYNDKIFECDVFYKNNMPSSTMPVFREKRYRACTMHWHVADEGRPYFAAYEVAAPGFSGFGAFEVLRIGPNLHITPIVPINVVG